MLDVIAIFVIFDVKSNVVIQLTCTRVYYFYVYKYGLVAFADGTVISRKQSLNFLIYSAY